MALQLWKQNLRHSLILQPFHDSPRHVNSLTAVQSEVTYVGNGSDRL